MKFDKLTLYLKNGCTVKFKDVTKFKKTDYKGNHAIVFNHIADDELQYTIFKLTELAGWGHTEALTMTEEEIQAECEHDYARINHNDPLNVHGKCMKCGHKIVKPMYDGDRPGSFR